MNCIKCGRELASEQLFCPECLAEMEKYPVKPGIAIQLPKPRETPVFKKITTRRRMAPEEQIKRLQRAVMILSTVLIAAVLAIGVLLYPMVKPLLVEEPLKPGQNYSSMETATTVSPTE